MSDSMLVRASRDGDQFHYLWAARRALRLLMPQSELVAMTIEGVSVEEFEGSGSVEDGEELIDIAEYYGSKNIEQASCIRYMQLKHSTLHSEKAWSPSGLEKTIAGFAKRYKALIERLSADHVDRKVEFWFVTNRPISPSFVDGVREVASQGENQDAAVYEKLIKYTSLDGTALVQFCKLLRFEGKHDDYWDQRNILTQDVAGYLPSHDVDAPMRLKELITRKALSESESDPSISKIDILRALQTDESGLFPSPCLIDRPEESIPREQEREIIETIINEDGNPIIISADAGV